MAPSIKTQRVRVKPKTETPLLLETLQTAPESVQNAWLIWQGLRDRYLKAWREHNRISKPEFKRTKAALDQARIAVDTAHDETLRVARDAGFLEFRAQTSPKCTGSEPSQFPEPTDAADDPTKG